MLITFGRSYLSLHLARLMAAAGHDVLITDSVRFPVTRFSSAIKKTFRAPRPRYEPVEWTQALAEIVRDEGVDMVVTVHEGTEILANTIKRYPDLFPDRQKLFLSSFDLEARLENKHEFQTALKTLGIPTLDFALVRSQEELEALDFDQPFALKRVYSRGSQDVQKVRPGDLPRGLNFDEENPWIAQEWADGTNYCSYSVCHDGQVKAHALYPVRYAIDGTSCLFFESVEHEGIAEWTRECVKAFDFTGQIGLDFIDVPGRGLFTVECNPRNQRHFVVRSGNEGRQGIFRRERRGHQPPAWCEQDAGPEDADVRVAQIVADGQHLPRIPARLPPYRGRRLYPQRSQTDSGAATRRRNRFHRGRSLSGEYSGCVHARPRLGRR